MHLVFDIFQGVGIAAAIGIRPFLPGVIAGVLAAIGLQIHFDHSDYGFLQSLPAIFLLLVAAVVLFSLERGPGEAWLGRRPVLALIGLISLGLGAVFFAGALARGGYAAWPGIPAGAACTAVAIAATRPLLGRVRSRLGAADTGTLPLYAEVAALLLAALSVLAPPIGPIGLLGLLWLLLAGRRRAGQKYAGLRILR